MNKFILLGGQRTGTTFLRDCIDSHPEAVCLNELFTLKRVAEDCYATYLKKSWKNRLLFYTLRQYSVRRYLDGIFENNQAKAVGFKFMYTQARYLPYQFPQVLQYARHKEMKIVHLIRKNYLRTIISRETAIASKVYHATKNVTTTPVRLDTQNIVAKLNVLRNEEAHWRKRLAAFDHLHLYYEDFVHDRQAETNKLCDFLGVAAGIELRSRLVKLNPPDIQTVVVNYDELARSLEGSEFQSLIEAK